MVKTVGTHIGTENLDKQMLQIQLVVTVVTSGEEMTSQNQQWQTAHIKVCRL